MDNYEVENNAEEVLEYRQEPLPDIFARAIRKSFSHRPEAILLALSGGVDSMVLCRLAAAWCKENKVDFYTVTVDHGLREGSSEEAKKVNQIVSSLGIKNEVIKWEKPLDVENNLESRARNGRYKILREYAEDHNIPVIMTAHHLDDQLETFFMRLERGSGVDGLSAMSRLKKLTKTIKIFRPLLEIKKLDLIAYAKENNIEWFEDETNTDEAFLRNKVRRVLSEIMDDTLLERRIERTIKHFNRTADFLDYHTKLLFRELCVRQGDGFSVDLEDFKSLHEEEALRLLVKLCNKITKSDYKPRFIKLAELYNKILSGKLPKRTSFAKTIISLEGRKLVFSKEYGNF